MITREEELEAQALRARGWSISAISQHLGLDRKTVRAYVNGDRIPGVREGSTEPVFEPFAAYVAQRLADDRHVWATALFDELVELGYAGSYSSMTAAIRVRELRPPCPGCAAAGHRESGIIEHPAGDETQLDWLELPNPPASWGLDGDVHLLVGSLAHSSMFRCWLAASEEQPHLIEGLDQICRRLGGVTTAWRFDRMATVCHPGSGKVTASFAAVARHYSVAVRVCPSRRGQRKGVVEKANHSLAQRWWRTLPEELPMAAAQANLDRFCVRVGDTRTRKVGGVKVSVAKLAAAEPLAPVPATPYPAQMSVARTVTDQALVAFRGNFYSVPPGMPGRVLQVLVRLGDPNVEVATEAGAVLARHRREPDGAGVVVRAEAHAAALEKAVLAGFSDRAACRSKTRRPPSPAALAAADQIRAIRGEATSGTSSGPGGQGVVADFAAYAAAVRPLTSDTGAAGGGGEERP